MTPGSFSIVLEEGWVSVPLRTPGLESIRCQSFRHYHCWIVWTHKLKTHGRFWAQKFSKECLKEWKMRLVRKWNLPCWQVNVLFSRAQPFRWWNFRVIMHVVRASTSAVSAPVDSTGKQWKGCTCVELQIAVHQVCRAELPGVTCLWHPNPLNYIAACHPRKIGLVCRRNLSESCFLHRQGGYEWSSAEY